MGEIGISWPGLVAQLLSFLILFGLLTFILYRPVRRMLDERSERIRTSMEQAEQIKETLAQTEGQVREHIDTARREGKNIVAQAGSVAEQIREEARREAREESQAIIDRARTEIERERDEAIDELKRQFVDLAIAAAERVIEETLDRDKHRQLIEDVLEEGGGKEG